jgi:hypothetical protein
MNPITIPNITIPVIGLPTIGIPSVGFPSASGGGLAWPAGLKESIKAIYDPAKQGMTNYDVIEAYAEDFTTWSYLDSRGIATITGNTIHITEAKSIQGIVEDNKEPYSDIKILVQGVTADNPLNVRDINGTKAVIDKDGVYEFKDNGLYFGFGFSKVGVVDVTITQLPTSILKDLSGNGNHAYLYGGKGKLNSGMGVYQQDFSKLIISRVDKKQDPFSFTVSGSGGTYLAYMQLGNWNNKAFKILANINAKNDYLHLRFRNNTDAVITSVALKNGENIIPAQNIEGATKAVFEYSLKEGETITITQIPDYPDQLCYDGKMYAVCYGFPILTDYTVMADRTWFDKTGVKYFLSKYKENESVPAQLFKFEWIVNGKEYSTSLGRDVEVVFPNGITWQTKTSYNGKGLPNSTYEDGDLLLIGKVWLNSTNYFIGCHGAIIVADRSFTEEEINWLKDNWEKI